MKQSIARIALVVDDYDKAIEFYTNKLDFLLVEDTDLGYGKRWVIVAPQGSSECSLVLAKADNEDQASRVGNQTGNRVFLFLYTDDFWRDYYKIVERGVKIDREPEKMPYGMVAVFKNLYGNKWDLLEPVLQ
ncbi:catechol 2,3-dioxygenase-like lactoylglutathione lyase family enzyme [Maribacter caenipelagi]|uniref:Catechol 2,3-dioxygenase-like lactoylglutathione lyase family enzyme n=1 Tax=Maribacter caenipelagi TaxID=1447781 RepID=A0A4R7D5J1_9FLAO|nr:VOC family protein [Maribacter caenipelagi]TDS15431.1 catechol 2,3-dioxygenase-like lactoylglutathione lyase family enzyme [Maribacter caenipelagi]